MPTYLLAWNPKKWRWGNLQDEIEATRRGDRTHDRWSCGNTSRIPAQSRFFLIRLGQPPRGIVGSGSIVSRPYVDAHWDPKEALKGKQCKFVEIEFDRLYDQPKIGFDILRRPPLDGFKWAIQMSGVCIQDPIARALEHMWAQATGQLQAPEELAGEYKEGSVKRILVNSYERDPDARAACLKYHGCKCSVCGFDFEEEYGPIAAGHIHVHHLIPLSRIRNEYNVDPIRDLCPVCPNCHAVIHLRYPSYSVDEVKAMLRTRQN